MRSDIPDRRRFLKTAAGAGVISATPALAGAAVADLEIAAGPANLPVPRRRLGRTGKDLPIIHLGTSQDLDPVYDKVMHRCYKAGVTWFDTALSYGWGASHAAIKNFLSQVKARDELWLTSKSGNRSPSGLEQAIDDALTQLETTYLNLYLMHGINDTDMLEPEFLKTGDRLRRSGKTQFFGFSCHGGNVVEVMNKAAKVGGIDAILFRYNFRRYGDRDLNLAMDRCHKAGIGLLAMKTQGSVPAHLEAVADFKSKNFSLGQAKLKSVWADERITSIVSEMDSVGRVRENVDAAKSEIALTAQESHQLNKLAHLTANYACQGCSHLCEEAAGGGVAIEERLRYLMYYECYGKTARARELYQGIATPTRVADEVAMKAACAVCPQGIDIPARLAEAHRVLA